MKLKPGVDWRGVDPVLWLYLGWVAVEHRVWCGEELCITELRRESSPRPSLHVAKAGETVQAADLRRHYLDERGEAEAFCRMLQARYGAQLAVVLEPEWLTPAELEERGGVLNVDPHIHVQLKSRDWPRL